jgi:uncharacterized protein (DUF1800 family)
MELSTQKKNQHLLWRAGFGPMIEMVNELPTYSSKDLFGLLLKTSSGEPSKFKEVNDFMQEIYNQMNGNIKPADLSREQKKMIRQQSREGIKELNLAWLNEMINSKAQLAEKMAFFWHGHFACRIVNMFFQQQLLTIVRKNALGNFGTLLKEVSKSPAMLSFLNNQQNKKQHPNENFAREVMELFTMGRGSYTENDIKEAARAFTGWGFNIQGEFVDRPFQHDNGTKRFLGKEGNFNGDDILNILLEQKQTARFITKKIYKYFVNDTIDNGRVEELATKFYNSSYDIKSLLTNIYTSEWFYEEKNIGNKIKSPVELLAGIRRTLPMQIDNEEAQLLFQKALGQILFVPPNVAGWPGGKTWIDSSSLMLRLRVPQIITNADEFSISPKEDDDTAMGQGERKKDKRFQVNANINWEQVYKTFEKSSRQNLGADIANALLQTNSKINTGLLDNYLDKSSRNNYIKTAVIQLMSTPEYQLC